LSPIALEAGQAPPVSQLTETERRKALDLLQALLAEAARENATENRAEAYRQIFAISAIQPSTQVDDA
jgi:hypothetical protein